MGKNKITAQGGFSPPPCQILAPEHQDVAIQEGIDGMQQHFLNEMEISQPRRVPRPSRVWLTPEGPGFAALVWVGMRGAASSRAFPMDAGSSRRRQRGASRAEPGIAARS